MKKTLLALIFICLIVGSCKTQQPINSTDKVEDKVHDTVKIFLNVNHTEAIHDTTKFRTPKFSTGNANCDSVCNLRYTQWLKSLNTKKSSGKNNEGMYYDSIQHMLIQYANLDAKNDSLTKIIKSHSENKSEQTIKEIPVKVPLSNFQNFLIYSGVTLWLVLIVYVGWKFNRYINPIKL